MSKNQVIAADRSLSIGLDVDSQTSFAVVLDTQTGEVLFENRIKHDSAAWEGFFARFPNCRMWACYEAGLTGFGLCRYLIGQGVDCQIAPPSQVPKGAQAKQQKTDHLDALTLAHMFWTPPRTWVHVPTEQEEADRQLSRTRDQVMNDRVRVKNRIKSLLLFHGLQSPFPPQRYWTKEYRRWLRTCDCLAATRIAIDVALDELEAIEQQLKVITKAIKAMNASATYRDRTQRLCQVKGVGELTVNAFVTEMYRPERFASGKQVGAHLGLTPCEWSSANTRHMGHITHWGPSHLRKLLVEAAWRWVQKDPYAKKKYDAIHAGKTRKVAIVAMARKLAVILWAMLVKEQDYNPACV